MNGVFWIVAAVASLLGLSMQAKAAPIQHVVIVFQENRTPDNLFHGLKAVLPAADIADSGQDSKGATIPLTAIPLANTYDLDHSHSAFLSMYGGGGMDGADLIRCHPKVHTTCPPFPQFKYVDPKDVQPYLSIAAAYGFANRMFQSNQGPSFPAHQFILAGTSQLTATSPLFAAENQRIAKEGVGCAAPADQRVAVIGPDGLEQSFVYPCFEHQTLTDLLNLHRPQIFWRYYTPLAGSIWTAPNAIRHICQPSLGSCRGPSWTNGAIVLNSPQVLLDIAAGDLAAVSWVIPRGQDSDHARFNEGTGPSWVASIVNAIGNSAYWDNTVILITWDDWGGWYDHVPPPVARKYGYYEYGFRVPLLVVSPYTAPGYVSEQTHDFGSILKFVETVFGLPIIPPGTFADSRADDLADFFDFAKAPRKFVPIPAPLGANYFLNDKDTPTAPDND
jgi:phospholipase C